MRSPAAVAGIEIEVTPPVVNVVPSTEDTRIGTVGAIRACCMVM